MENQNMLSSESEYNSLIDSIKEKAHPNLGILLGIAMGILGAFVWAAITIITGYNIGFVAIGVGFLVSLGFTKAGKDTNAIYGVIAGVIALLSIFLGEAMINIYYVATYYEVGIIDALLNIDYNVLLEIIFEGFDVKSVIFYFIAVSAAFKGSYINIDKLIIGMNALAKSDETSVESDNEVKTEEINTESI